MLLIDILNGLYFGGADFLPALEAGKRRVRFLNPFLRRILKYAANEPEAYKCRFTESLLDSAAFLLAESGDPEFVELALPLIDAAAEPNLIGFLPEDDARLLAASLGNRVGSVIPFLRERQPSDEFCSAAFEALLLAVHWSPDLRKPVVSVFCELLRAEWLHRLSPDAKDALVNCCSRLDCHGFLLDLYLAVGRGDLDETATTEAIDEAGRRRSETVWLDDWEATNRLTADDSFLSQHLRIFHSMELREPDDQTDPNPDALAAFNTVAAPARDYEDRLAAIQPASAVVDIARRVLRLAAAKPDDFRYSHLSTAVLAAICLGSPSGDDGFTHQFVRLLSLPKEQLDYLLGDDLTGLCETALALAGRFAPTTIRQLVENRAVSGVCRSVAFGALALQARLGYVPENEISEYCRDLVNRRDKLGREVWLWADVAKVCGELRLADLQSVLMEMAAEDFFLHESGDIWIEEDEIEQMFVRVEAHEVPPTNATTPLSLLCRSTYHGEYQSVREFLSNLESPRLHVAESGKR